MKNRAGVSRFFALAAAISLVQSASAQWAFTTNNGAITITGYSGLNPWPVIPAATNGYPVVAIGGTAFAGNPAITNVTIPGSVTNIGAFAFENSGLVGITIPGSVTGIGEEAFVSCEDLAGISVNAANPAYSSLNGVLFDKAQAFLIQYPLVLANDSYTLPAGVTTIADDAFYGAASLTSVTIPISVNSIGNDAFANCDTLMLAYFEGNAPSVGSYAFYGTDFGDGVTIYYLPGTTGWAGFSTASGQSLALSFWYLPGPEILSFEPSFGVRSNQFRFTISWATNATVVVDACTNLANPLWLPISTNTVTVDNGTNDFADPQWQSFSMRFYRLRLQ